MNHSGNIQSNNTPDIPSVLQIATSINKAAKSSKHGRIFMTPKGFKKMNWLQAGAKWLKTGFKVHLVSDTMITSIGDKFKKNGVNVDQEKIKTLSASQSQILNKPSKKASALFAHTWNSISKLSIEDAKFQDLNIEKKQLTLIKELRKKNIDSINNFRQSKAGGYKSKKENNIDIKKFAAEFEILKKELKPHIKKLKFQARRRGVKQLNKDETSNLKGVNKRYALTTTKAGDTFIHVSNSAFTRGGQKVIQIAVKLETGEVAIRSKSLKKKNLVSDDEPKSAIANKMVMDKCKSHPNIVIPHSVVVTESKNKEYWSTAMIMDFCNGGDLSGIVLTGRKFHEHAYNASKGLAYMHTKNLVHGDVKPENFALHNGMVKLIDLDTSQALRDEFIDESDYQKKQFLLNSSCHTPQYQAPEARNYNLGNEEDQKLAEENPMEYVKSGEVYSFGVSLFEMQNQIPGEGEGRAEKLLQMVEAFKTSKPESETDKFILKMLNNSPTMRPTMSEVREFFKASIAH